MGRQRTRDDRSLLESDSNAGGASGGTGRSTSGRQRRTDARSSVDGGTDRSRNGIWDADSLAKSGEVEPDESQHEATQHEEDQHDEQELEEGVVPVDRDKLTDRQLEVLETAHDMGYYQYPRGANASEVAASLDICPSTLAEHLAAAQTKLLADVLGERDE